jgi:hypothetical protein
VRGISFALALLLAAPARVAADDEAPHTEIGVLPGVNYNTDTGLGVGVVTALARIAPDVRPFRWRLQTLLYLSVKRAPGGGLEIIEHDYYADLDVPNLAGGKLRLRGRLNAQRLINTGWYGFGNATEVDESADAREYQYDRVWGRAEGLARLRVAPLLELTSGFRATVNVMNPYPDSRFAADQDRLTGGHDHGELVLMTGVLWDVRDDEYVPSRGGLLEIAARGGAGLGERFGYGGLTMHARGFVPLVGRRLVLASKLIGDLLFGDPPFYELARHGGLWQGDATGGGTSIRGIPAQRYHGEIKVQGSVELRLEMVPFRIGSQRFVAGLLAFVDGGRVFHDQALDGSGLGLHLGLGGGLRLQWGKTFVGRADYAVSPEGTSGLYLGVGHIY